MCKHITNIFIFRIATFLLTR